MGSENVSGRTREASGLPTKRKEDEKKPETGVDKILWWQFGVPAHGPVM